MATNIKESKLLFYHAAWFSNEGKDFCKEAAKAKLNNTKIVVKIIKVAIQIYIGYYYAKIMRNVFLVCKIIQIGGLTIEIR